MPSAGRRRTKSRPFPPERRFVTGALRAGRHASPVHGLISVDISAARAELGDGETLTGFLVGAIAKSAMQFPEVHGYRNLWGRVVIPDRADIATIVEVDGPTGHFPLAHVIKNADRRSISDISAEIRSVKSDPNLSRSGTLLNRATMMAARLPGALALFYLLAARTTTVRQLTGTISVTSVGMFAGGGGFGIGMPTLMSLTVLIGGASRRAVVIDGELAIRELVDLTVTIDHNIVDGAPAARFVAELRGLVESASRSIVQVGEPTRHT